MPWVTLLGEWLDHWNRYCYVRISYLKDYFDQIANKLGTFLDIPILQEDLRD